MIFALYCIKQRFKTQAVSRLGSPTYIYILVPVHRHPLRTDGCCPVCPSTQFRARSRTRGTWRAGRAAISSCAPRVSEGKRRTSTNISQGDQRSGDARVFWMQSRRKQGGKQSGQGAQQSEGCQRWRVDPTMRRLWCRRRCMKPSS